jgi:hypothetical protein
MSYQIITAPYEEGQTEEQVFASVASANPNSVIEGIRVENGIWEVRLASKRVSKSKRTADFPDDFPGDAKPDSDADAEDDVPDEAEPPKDDSEDKNDEKPSKDKEDKPKDKEKSDDPVGQIEKLITQVQDLLGELGGKAKEVTDKAKEHSDKVDEIHKLVDPDADVKIDGVDDMPPVPGISDVGPTPGGGGAPVPPKPHLPGAGPDHRKPPFLPGGGVSTFTKRRTEIVTHPGVDESGTRITIRQAAAELEADEEYTDYAIASIREDNGKYIAKLQLKD